jgi:uncharacterized protein YcbK (DUF882 family)
MGVFGPTQHLTWREMACHDGTEYPKQWRDSRAVIIAQAFEGVRKLFGDKPIKILSGYRTETYNKKIGGAKFSQHVQGRALDLRPPDGVDVDTFYNTIRANVDSLGIHGLGRYTTFVHIDVRPTDKLVSWKGYGVKDANS